MHILIASSSVFRQRNYREAVEVMGHRATTATDGVECVHRLRAEFPDMLILEAPLLWGGTEGVLEVARDEARLLPLPVILVAVGGGSIDWFQLSRFRIDQFLFRLPTAQELSRAVADLAEFTIVGSKFRPAAAGEQVLA